MQFYPARALGAVKFGSATLQCQVKARKATQCAIEREDGDLGFGGMALRAAVSLPIPPVADGGDVQLDYQIMILDLDFDSHTDESLAGRIARCKETVLPPITDAGPVATFPVVVDGKLTP